MIDRMFSPNRSVYMSGHGNAAAVASEFGKAHYSYSLAMSRYVGAFDHAGIGHQLIARTEVYHHPMARDHLPPVTSPSVHVGFKNFRNIRPLKFAYNINVVAWEFHHLLNYVPPGEPLFYNQVQMLLTGHETWVMCSFTEKVLRDHGIVNVHTVPTPIPIPSQMRGAPKSLEGLALLPSINLQMSNYLNAKAGERMCSYAVRPLFDQPGLAGGLSNKKIFIAIFNPNDARKNIDALLMPFDAYSRDNPDAVLIIKVAVSENQSLNSIPSNLMKLRMIHWTNLRTDNVIIIKDFLSDKQMADLYRLADFYLCTAHGEGQNLPLMEAMAHGVVPVSVDNTAMGDVVNDRTAFVIPSHLSPVSRDKVAYHVRSDMLWYECDHGDVYRALAAACEASPLVIAEKSHSARENVIDGYSKAAVGALIENRLDQVWAGEPDLNGSRANAYA